MFKRALASVFRSADGAGVLVVGGVLTLLTWAVTPLWIAGSVAFPPLVVVAPLALAPAFVTRGYFVRVLADAAATETADGAPPFVAWNELYKNGVKSAVLSAVLLAPLALLVAVVAVAGVVLGTELVGPAALADRAERTIGTEGAVAVTALGTGALAVVSAAYLVAFAYVRPAALAGFAVSGRLREGFRPRRVGRVAGSGAYATTWLVAVVTLLIGYAVAAPFVPVLVGVAIVFVTRIVVYALYGHGAGATLSVEDGTAEVADPEESSVRSPIPRRPAPEAPPAVQTGRAVSFGGDVGELVGAEGGGASGAGDGVTETGGDGVTETGGDGRTEGIMSGGPADFEWTTVVDGERSETDEQTGETEAARGADRDRVESGHDRESDGGSDDAGDARFDWGSPSGGREDKS